MLILYSRVERIGGPDLAPGCGYRDILIHEMTESEIQSLKTQRWMFPLMASALGFAAGAAFVFWQLAPAARVLD